jgi:hypothetical protein
MQLDIYQRPEPEHKLSYLAVPAGQPIPAEAENVEWKLVASATEIDASAPHLGEYAIDDAAGQIQEKGYAITSLDHQVEARD